MRAARRGRAGRRRCWASVRLARPPVRCRTEGTLVVPAAASALPPTWHEASGSATARSASSSAPRAAATPARSASAPSTARRRPTGAGGSSTAPSSGSRTTRPPAASSARRRSRQRLLVQRRLLPVAAPARAGRRHPGRRRARARPGRHLLRLRGHVVDEIAVEGRGFYPAYGDGKRLYGFPAAGWSRSTSGPAPRSRSAALRTPSGTPFNVSAGQAADRRAPVRPGLARAPDGVGRAGPRRAPAARGRRRHPPPLPRSAPARTTSRVQLVGATRISRAARSRRSRRCRTRSPRPTPAARPSWPWRPARRRRSWSTCSRTACTSTSVAERRARRTPSSAPVRRGSRRPATSSAAACRGPATSWPTGSAGCGTSPGRAAPSTSRRT